MNESTLEKLQYYDLLELLKEYCSSSLGRKLASELRPSKHIDVVRHRLNETTEAKKLLGMSSHLSVSGTESIMHIVTDLEKDMILSESQLSQVLQFVKGNQKLKNFMSDKAFFAPYLFAVSEGLIDLRPLGQELESSVSNGQIVNEASSALKNIRRHIINTEVLIKEGLEKYLRNAKNHPHLQEHFISEKNGRLTIPIKASSKTLVSGTIISSTAKTVYLEPSTVSKHTDKLHQLKIDESEEVYRILCELTNLVYDQLEAIKYNIETVGVIDLAFAKGKFSKAIGGEEVVVNDYDHIKIVNGRHPLLTGDVVPLNVEVGKDFRTLVITGPNAGGKTVVLKTIGLLTVATQAGLHIPCDPKTTLSIYENVFADIGDDQSIENALSTFSSHVKNLSYCINHTNNRTLLLFDEIGSGTEPNEGSALAIAILEEIYHRGATTVATTHYNAIKEYAMMHSDFETAAMKFDKETLVPMYELQIGKTGESNALWISRKMGMKSTVLEVAEKYMNKKEYDLQMVSSERIRKSNTTSKEVKKYYDYKVGDRIEIKSLNKIGLVYQVKDDRGYVKVFVDDEVEEHPIRLLTLLNKSEDLYPEGYDMDQLFRSFKERKLERDVKRGSKKALKKIRKHGYDQLLK